MGAPRRQRRSVDLEEQVCGIRLKRQITELIDDQQLGPGVDRQLLVEPTIAMRLGKRRHQGGRSDELDAVVVPDRLSAEADGQMRLSGARRAEQQQCIAMGDPTTGGQFADLTLVERGLGAPVEAVEFAHERELGDLGRHIDASRRV